MAIVSKLCMIDVAWELGDKWKNFGHQTNLSSEVKKIGADNRNDVFEQAYQILKAWKESNASNATYEELGKVLKTVQRADLADEYCNGGNNDATDPGMYIRSHRWNHV